MGWPRKNHTDAQCASVSSDDSNRDKLDEILECLASLDGITKKLSNLKSMLAATQAENKELKETVRVQNGKIQELRDRVNNLEQHGRSFSVQVNNLHLEKDLPVVIKKSLQHYFSTHPPGCGLQACHLPGIGVLRND
jgi:chromosome segregation ATPase